MMKTEDDRTEDKRTEEERKEDEMRGKLGVIVETGGPGSGKSSSLVIHPSITTFLT